MRRFASVTRPSWPPTAAAWESRIFQGFALSLTVANEAEADQVFKALSDGGQVQMAMTKTFFSPRFGMVADRFGVAWMVYVAPKG
jgi:PhnB protein